MCHPGADPFKATDGILQDSPDQRELGEAQTCAVRSEVRGQDDDVACGSASIARRVEVGHDRHVCESPFVARTTAQITHGTAQRRYRENPVRGERIARRPREPLQRQAARRKLTSISGSLWPTTTIGERSPGRRRAILAASASERRRSSAWARVRPSLRWTTRSGTRRQTASMRSRTCIGRLALCPFPRLRSGRVERSNRVARSGCPPPGGPS